MGVSDALRPSMNSSLSWPLRPSGSVPLTIGPQMPSKLKSRVSPCCTPANRPGNLRVVLEQGLPAIRGHKHAAPRMTRTVAFRILNRLFIVVFLRERLFQNRPDRPMPRPRKARGIGESLALRVYCPVEEHGEPAAASASQVA